MAKVYAERVGFKKLEEAMREVPNGVRAVLAQIDQLQAGKRTAKEAAFLNALREQARAFHQQAIDFYGQINSPDV